MQNKIDFRKIISERMYQLKFENSHQLAIAVNNFWLAAEVKRLGGKLPENTQRITHQTVSNYLAGKSELTTGNLELILNCLGLKPDFRFT